MTTIATLAVKLIADAAGFIAAMDSSEKKTQTWSQNVSNNMKNVGGNISSFGQKATGYLTLPLIAGGIAAINYASDLEETKSKVNVVFGSMADDVMKWSQTSATALGQSQNQALTAAANYGNLFITLGLGQKPATDMSTTLVKLAADLASFNNANPEEVLQALQSGLIGQSEPMRKYGVNLNEATVALKAMEMGLVETNVDMVKANGLILQAEKYQAEYNKAIAWYGEDSLQAREVSQKMAEVQQRLDEVMQGSTENMTEAVKVQARYALIMEQTKTAQGDFARTSEGLANQQRIVKAQFIDTATALGYQLLPYALKLMEYISVLITQFQGLTPEQQKWVVGFAAIIAIAGPLLMVIGGLITAIGTIVGVVGAISAPIWIVIAVIAALIAIGYLLYQAWINNWGGIQEKTAAVLAFIQGLIQMGLQFIEDLTTGKLGAVSQIWNNTFLFIQTYIQNFIIFWQAIFAAFAAAANGDWYAFGENMRVAFDTMLNTIGALIQTSWANISTAVSALVTNVIEFFKTVDWGAVGTSIVQGIANGITAAVGFIRQAAQSAAQAALDAAKGFLGIKSPARRPRKEVGYPIGQGQGLGWIDGLTSMIPAVQNSVDNMMRMAMPSVMPAVPELSAAGVGVPAVNQSLRNGGTKMIVVPVTYEDHSLINVNKEYEAKAKLREIVNDINRENENK